MIDRVFMILSLIILFPVGVISLVYVAAGLINFILKIKRG